MVKTRKRFKGSFKAKVALEAVENFKTLSELSQKHDVHPTQITAWKKVVQTRAVELFGTVIDKEKIRNAELVPKLYQEIGVLKMDLDWLKKK